MPHPVFGLVFGGLHWSFLRTILVTAIPFGIYDLVEAMDNVVSASSAGDSYPTTRVLTADGVVSLIGCLVGNPYINAVYIGHPGWKSMGGRIGYSAATGIMVIILSWFGIISLMSALIPVIAIAPILLYIGMLIGSQAFQETPRRHAPGVVLAVVPAIAAWGLNQVNGALHAAGIFDVTDAIVGKMAGNGVIYRGLEIVGGGSILGGLILGAITVFIIDRQFMKASGFALAGAILTFLGFMHGEEIGFNMTPRVAISYVIVSGILLACACLIEPAEVMVEEPEHEEEVAVLAT